MGGSLLPVCWQWGRAGIDSREGEGGGWSKVHLFDNWANAGGYAMCGLVPDWQNHPARFVEGKEAYAYAEPCMRCHPQQEGK